MTRVGAYEAKTHLPQLLERVGRGEKIVITKHGRAVAMLVPLVDEIPELTPLEAVREMKKLRKGNVLGDDLTIRDLINEGRRF